MSIPVSPPRASLSAFRACALAAVVGCAFAARADEPHGTPGTVPTTAPDAALTGAPPPPVAEAPRSTPARVALFLGGAGSAFLLHESGHVLAGAALGRLPELQRVTFLGFIPFFTLAPSIACFGDTCTRKGEPFGPGRAGVFLIFSAGFDMQHLEDEVILTHDPRLREKDNAFREGMLAFNTLTSVGYVTANLLGVEPRAGDVRSMIEVAGRPRLLVDGLLLGTAVLDLVRYAYPELVWPVWASRAAKLGLGGLVFVF